jgi:hypothetical protein
VVDDSVQSEAEIGGSFVFFNLPLFANFIDNHSYGAVILRLFFFSPTILHLPHQYSPHHCPFTPVVPGYGVYLFEDDYLFLLPAADLRMDPALRPLPVSSIAFAYLGDTLQRQPTGSFFLSARETVCFFFFFL